MKKHNTKMEDEQWEGKTTILNWRRGTGKKKKHNTKLEEHGKTKKHNTKWFEEHGKRKAHNTKWDGEARERANTILDWRRSTGA